MANHNFGRKARSWFEAFLNNWMGCRHAPKVIIRYGVSKPDVLTHLIEAIKQEKRQEREDAEEAAHGAEELVWKLKRDAYAARADLRHAQSLARKVEEGRVDFDPLTPEQKESLGSWPPIPCRLRSIAPTWPMGTTSRGRMTSASSQEKTCVCMCPSTYEPLWMC